MTPKEKLLLNQYDKFIDLVLGDYPIDRIDEIAVKDVMGYGTTIDEKLFNIEGLNDLVVRQREQGNGAEVDIKTERIFQKLFSNDEAALIVDEFQINMIIDGMTHVIPLRISTVLEFIDNNWKVIHWHGSVAVESEDDSWHINEWKQKNEKLQRLVDEQTADLVNKNHELEIEAALERVRAVAMSMSNSEDLLKICEATFKELQQLGFDNLRNAVIHILYNEQKYFMDYDFSDFTGGQIGKVEYGLHPIVDDYLKKIRSAEDAFFEIVIAEDMLEDWNEFRRKSGQMSDQRLDEADALYYYLFSIGIGDIGISTFQPINDSQIKILKRFRNVFDLAYSRYNDIKLAEEQAREAQIEAALERIRARAMGMHKSEEVGYVSDMLFSELNQLEFEINGSSIVIIDEEKDKMELWRARSNVAVKPFEQSSFKKAMKILKKNMPSWHPIFLNSLNKRENYLVDELSGKRRLKFIDAIAEQYNYSNKEKNKLIENTPNTISTHYIFFKLGYLALLSERKLSEENISIVRRFVEVFDFSYTRFLDIKKAEAQARESEIQLALERVRSRTMAMQHSDELSDAAFLLAQQVRDLGINAWGCAFHIYADNEDGDYEWFSNEEGYLPFYKTPRKRFFKKYYEKRKNGEPLYVEEFKGKKCENHYKYLMSLPVVGDALKNLQKSGIRLPESQIDHVAYFKYGYLLFITYEPVTEAYEIFKRFAKEFEQTYTRFLDLQKAEAQAREAQIEAALERVRSRSMAMHSSNELVETSDVMFAQMKALGIESLRVGIGTMNEEDKTVEIWSRSEIEGKVENKIIGVVPYGVHPVFDNMVKAWREKQPYFASERIGDEVKDYYKRLSKYLTYPLPKKFNKRESVTTFFFKAGSLNVISLKPLKKEECDIMIRFAKVFEQTYTRFLDLKKAEAQAKEAQIEAALEKVRSIALSMNKPEDMVNVCHIISDQLNNLGIDNIRNVQTAIIDYDKAIYFNYQYFSAYKKGIIEEINYKKNSHPKVIEMVSAMKKSEDSFFTGSIEGESLKSFREYRKSDSQLADPILDKSESISYYFNSIGNGGLGLTTYKPLIDEELDIFKRFHNVFKFSYKRFNDLQKNEAQAREVEIELALERVRARTMAMQRSNELAQVAANLFEQMKVLGINPYRCNIAIVDNENKKLKLWSTTNHGNVIPLSRDIPFNENPVFKEIHNGWKKQKKNHTIKLVGEDRVTWTKYITKYVPFEEYKPENFNKSKLMKEVAFFNNFYFRQGFFVIHTKEEIKDKDFEIIQRFANVFEQTYTRFLDLENAEYQNKIIQAENQRKTEELEEARKLQLSMLPKDLPKIKNLDIAVYMQTASEVGGDYYDFYVDNNGVLTGVVGDATGHGMKAGTIVTITKSMFNSLVTEHTILESLLKISKLIKDMNFRQLSMCLMMFKISDDELLLSSAAMPPIFIFRARDKKVEEFELRGMPLGTITTFPYKLVNTKIHNGDTIMMMSDGFPELLNEQKHMIGYERTKQEFEKVGNKKPEEIVRHFKKIVSKWTSGKAPDDDVTFVVIKVK